MAGIKQPITVRTVAEWVGGTVEGDDSVTIGALAPLEQAGPNDLTFAADPKRVSRLGRCKAGAAIVDKSAPSAPMALIRVENVQAAVAALLGKLAAPTHLPPAGVDKTATVADDAELGEAVAVGPNVVVAPRAKIADGTVLCANVVIGADVEIASHCLLREGVCVLDGCKLGTRVQVGPNSIIGSEGFGYYFADGAHRKVPHAGNVVIEDDVEIGACSCVDRAKFGSTRIGAGTKIDNLVQVAHNVQVGRGCILAGQVGIAGSAELGDFVIVGGSAGIRDNITVGAGAQVAAYSAVAEDVPDGQAVVGVPAGPARETLRAIKAMNKLPELLKRVRQLETRLEALESTKNNKDGRHD